MKEWLAFPRVLAGLALLLCAPGPALAEPATLSGPVEGGSHGRPFAASLADLAAQGYVETEYFLAGTATAYVAAGPLGSDGRWDVAPAASQPFKTRILVRRPKDPAKFNGTVVVEWLNVSGGFDIDAAWGYAYPVLMREGFAWVGVSAQRAGVEGPPLRPGLSQPLKLWDPARYGGLANPGDDFSYDIFTQAARAVGPKRPAGLDPLAGLTVARVLGAGVSQSANRLATYVDAVQPTARALDGILIASRIGARGGAAPLAADRPMPDPVRIRDDLAVPVLVLETESDALSHFPARTPDTDRYRLWEMAGTAHQNRWADTYFGAEIARDLGKSTLGGCADPVNGLPTQHVYDAAIHHLDAWVRDRKPPPTAPRIAISGAPPAIERDAAGNALGGLRLPGLAVPTARYGGVGTPDSCRSEGFEIGFPKPTLDRLYPSHAVYVAKFTDATRAAESTGFILGPEAADEIREAEAARTP